ncbi:hypothetical protein DYB36_004817 [Aphanomyces astaci]|uniref:Glutamine amidotransferase domain-containing protein n=2 Tax=Aphanomyces astaci TaxID=112090 RepID=A0A397A225_APHAT|nr:hypothetical protein DYB36_004817 [Aphanomyces astaci]
MFVILKQNLWRSSVISLPMLHFQRLARADIAAASWLRRLSTSHAPLRFLIVEGYSEEGRKELVDNGARIASDLYATMLASSADSIPTTHHVIYPTDGPFELPDLSQFDGVAWTGFAVFAAGGKVAKNPNGREMGLARKFWGLQYHPEYNLHEMARLTHARRGRLVNYGLFRDMAAADRYVAELELLYANPHRKDIAWRLGIDADVLDDDIRCIEVKNYIKHLVLPYKQARALLL